MEWKIIARGHENILAKHRTTWQLTKEAHLSPRGDCIIGVSANTAACDLPRSLQDWLQDENWVKIILDVQGNKITGKGQGSADLTFSDPIDMVFRRSTYTCGRTITINTSFTAQDISPAIVSLLQEPKTRLEVTLKPMKIS